MLFLSHFCPKNPVRCLSVCRPDRDRESCPEFHCPCPPTSGLSRHLSLNCPIINISLWATRKRHIFNISFNIKMQALIGLIQPLFLWNLKKLNFSTFSIKSFGTSCSAVRDVGSGLIMLAIFCYVGDFLNTLKISHQHPASVKNISCVSPASVTVYFGTT